MTASATKARPHNLPTELTSFVGRRRELSEVKQALATARLLTLTGAGGIGKTRLGLRAAAEVTRPFPDGSWVVDLAPIDDPSLLTQAVFLALGLHDQQAQEWSVATLIDYLAPRRLLLVVDNCEHLLDACAVLVGTVLRSCPHVHILATSRQALSVAGEVRFAVPPLSIPPRGSGYSAEGVLDSDAAALFEERAAAVAPGFHVGRENAGLLAKLCQRLDGIPLAIELAAVRLASLDLDQLTEALSDQLPILGHGDRSGSMRQQTLDATIDWSYELLSEVEQILWARLSVFAGGFDCPAVEQVCSEGRVLESGAIEVIAALTEKSMVIREPTTNVARYRLLETMRQFGRERLRQRGEEAGLRARHSDWVRRLASAAARPDAEQAAAFDKVQLELGNVWSALDYLLKGTNPERGLELMYDLALYWVARGPLTDARRVIVSFLDATHGDTLERGKGFCVAGQLARSHRDEPTARSLLEESLRIGRHLMNSELIGWSLFYLAAVDWAVPDLHEARAKAETVLALSDSMSNAYLRVATLTMLASLHMQQGERSAALALGEEAARLGDHLGEMYFRSYAIWDLANSYLHLGDVQRADSLGREALALQHRLGPGEGLAIAVETLAWIASRRGEAQRAAQLLGAADSVYKSIPATLLAIHRATHEECVGWTRGRMGAAGFQAAFEDGASMTREEIVACALEQDARETTRAMRKQTSPLTRRELEVARLVAMGLSNKQIAARLFISERTAETHLTNMLNKLGLSSRLQLAQWVDLPRT